MRPAAPTSGASSGMPVLARNRPARAGENSAGSAVSYTTTTFAGSASSWSAMACDMQMTSVAKCRVRNRSTRSTARDCTTISRPCQTCGRRVSAAAAHAYHECSEFVCTTSMSRRRMSRTIRATAIGQPIA